MSPAPRVLVTRPRAQALEWVAELRALGVPCAALPLLDVAPAADPAPVRAAAQALASADLVMFVSPNAVAHWRAVLAPDWAWPAGVLAGATGPGTVTALRAAGVPTDCIVAPPDTAPRFDSEALWAVLQPRRNWAGAQVQIVRGEGGRDWFAQTLRQAGAEVRFVQAYRRGAPALRPDEAEVLQAALDRPQAHVWLFSSSEAVGVLATLACAQRPDTATLVWPRSQALATHPRIAEAARALGFGQVRLVAPFAQAVQEAWRQAF